MKVVALFVLISGLTGLDAVKPVTNEDIRDAILSVVYVIRSTEDKLERHEFRERALGEQLKKVLATIDKRLKFLDPVKGTVSRLDERLATVETILMQKDERERIQFQKTLDVVEDIQRTLPGLVNSIKDQIPAKPTSQNEQPTKGLQDAVEGITGKLQGLNSTLNELKSAMGDVKTQVQGVKNDTEQLKRVEKPAFKLDDVQKHLNTTTELLEKYESKLAEYNNRIPTDVAIPVAQFDEETEWQKNLMQALDVHKGKVDQVLQGLTDVSNKLSSIPTKPDLEKTQNLTLDRLQEVHRDYIDRNDRSLSELKNELAESINKSLDKQLELADSIEKTSNSTDKLTNSIAESYQQLKWEIQSLNKVEQLMVQTADSVLDTRRRVEYGVHQILLEVTSLIKNYGKDTNAVINERFDTFEMSILDEETGALANLTSKIGQEIDQVWRQIGIMHQQMSASADTLNKLQNQTDAYVNGSLNVMDSMKGKVGQITGRMTEVDDNLNYLLGRLSLVTQEFNLIKKGLGSALDEIKESFNAVQKKVKDAGPGPHKINSNEIDDSSKPDTK